MLPSGNGWWAARNGPHWQPSCRQAIGWLDRWRDRGQKWSAREDTQKTTDERGESCRDILQKQSGEAEGWRKKDRHGLDGGLASRASLTVCWTQTTLDSDWHSDWLLLRHGFPSAVYPRALLSESVPPGSLATFRRRLRPSLPPRRNRSPTEIGILQRDAVKLQQKSSEKSEKYARKAVIWSQTGGFPASATQLHATASELRN